MGIIIILLCNIFSCQLGDCIKLILFLILLSNLQIKETIQLPDQPRGPRLKEVASIIRNNNSLRPTGLMFIINSTLKIHNNIMH